MNRFFLILLLAFSQATSAVELFGIPLVSADKGNLGFAVQRAGATLQQTERNQVFEVFNSTEILDTSFKLYLGFDVQTGKFGFAEYHINVLSHRKMLARLRTKYGEPAVAPGEFISDDHYTWQVNGIDISYRKAQGCMCSRLIYSEPATLEIVRQQHEQVQKQRADEATEKFRKAF